VTSTSQSPATAGATLVRAIGVRALSAGLFNTIVGAGIFVLPATVAGLIDRGAPFAYLTCAIAIMFTTLCYAAAGSRVVDAGGSYAYIGAAFGPLAGFLGGVMVWLSDVLATAGVASAFAAGVALYVPAIGSPAGRMALVVAIVGGLAAINLRGVKQGTRFMEVVTVAKLAPLVLFIAVGLVLRRHDLPLPAVPSGEALGRATLILMFVFSGAESAVALSGEVTDPVRTIPRALLFSLALVTLLYGLVHLVAQATLGPALVTSTVAPLADAANALAGSPFRTMMLLGTLLSMLGYLSAVALATPRTLFAMAGDGILPALQRVHPRFRTPHVAIVFHTAAVVLVASVGSFAVLVPFASVAVLVLYLSVSLASWELQRRGVSAGSDVFNVPAVVPAIASAFCLWLLWNASGTELMMEAIVMVAAIALYVFRKFTSARS
jgi:basic amino acid/polyamine antiporter, APA family